MKTVLSMALAFGLSAVSAQAADTVWPKSPVTLIVPYGTGGGTDSTARALASSLSKAFDVPVVVENHPGAGGALALSHFLNSVEPDGQTILVGQTGILTTTPILNDVAYKREDFRAIASLATPIEVLVVSNEFPATSPKEFMEYASANPDEMSMVVSSMGSQGWMGIQQLQNVLGFEIPFVPLPHGGGSNQATMVAGNHAKAGVISLTGVASFLEAGQMKAVGLLQAERSNLAPDLPTFVESGYDVSIGDEVMVFVRSETAPEIVASINDALTKAYEDSAYLKTLENLKLEANYRGADSAGEFLASRVALAEKMLAK